jgi:hypothetical protein
MVKLWWKGRKMVNQQMGKCTFSDSSRTSRRYFGKNEEKGTDGSRIFEFVEKNVDDFFLQKKPA